MSRVRYLTIPLNESAMENYYNGIENDGNSLEWSISEMEFEQLLESKVFDTINEQCKLMIDDFESEIVEKGSIENALKCIKDAYSHDQRDVLKTLLGYAEKALECGTIMAFDF